MSTYQRPAYYKTQSKASAKPQQTHATQTTLPTYEQFADTTTLVVSFWAETKLFSTKADKQQLLIIDSLQAFKAIINTKYHLITGIATEPTTIEAIFGTDFAKDVTAAAMQELLTGYKAY